MSFLSVDHSTTVFRQFNVVLVHRNNTLFLDHNPERPDCRVKLVDKHRVIIVVVKPESFMQVEIQLVVAKFVTIVTGHVAVVRSVTHYPKTNFKLVVAIPEKPDHDIVDCFLVHGKDLHAFLNDGTDTGTDVVYLALLYLKVFVKGQSAVLAEKCIEDCFNHCYLLFMFLI